MTAVDVLVELVARRAVLWVEEQHLRFRAPEGALDGDLRAAAGAVRSDLVALVADGAVLPPERATWDQDAADEFEERAAIIEFDGGLARAEAEALADLFVRAAWTRDYLRRLGAAPADPLPDADPVDHPAVAVAPFPGREAARTG